MDYGEFLSCKAVKADETGFEISIDAPTMFDLLDEAGAYCKKNPAHKVQKGYDLVITGERRDEGGMRSVPKGEQITSMCFYAQGNQFRLRPLFYVSDSDKKWYKEYYSVRYSDAYEVYGLKRTGCCGCAISSKAVEELEMIRPYEPNLVKAAWNVFGDSYRFRQKYDEYRKKKTEEKKNMGQLKFLEDE